MKKIMYSFIILFISIFINIEVNALINNEGKSMFFDPTQYDFKSEWEKIDNDYEEVNNRITNIKETSDGGLILVLKYKESDQQIAGLKCLEYEGGKCVSSEPTGTYTLQMDHAKLVKLNANYEIEWITKYYAVGNWSYADPLAPTVGTTISDVVELSDGSFIAGGEVRGYQSSSTTISSGDAFYIRVSSTGEILHEYKYKLNGVKDIKSIGTTTDGKYIIGYEYENDKSSEHPDFATMGGVLKPDNFDVTDSGIYYVVYNNNNEVIDTIYEEQKEQLISKYSLENNYKYTLYNYDENLQSKSFIGIDSRGYATYFEGSYLKGKISFYDTTTMNLVSSFETDERPLSLLLTNNGNIILGNKIYDTNGKYISSIDIRVNEGELNAEELLEYKGFGSINEKKLTLSQISFIKKNGDLMYISQSGNPQYLSGGGYESYQLHVKKANTLKNSEDPVKFIINGNEINYNLGTFLENERIYIKLSNLCYVMDCSYQKGVGNNNNMLVIKFNATLNNKMIDLSNNAGYINYYSNLFDEDLNRLMYTITHEIGTKTYHAYLEYQPYAVFALKSPTYDANAVDVASKEIDGEVYIPIRFISEAMGRYVDYTPATETEKAIVTIHGYGEGEFYEKYTLAASTSKLSNGDTITNIKEGETHNISYDTPLSYIELPWDNTEYLYGYGYEIETNKVVSVENTMWLYGYQQTKNANEDFLGKLPYDGRNQLHYLAGGGNFNGKYNILLMEVNKNVLGKGSQLDLSSTANENAYNEFKEINDEFYPFFLISNIEGYPFIKFYTLH